MAEINNKKVFLEGVEKLDRILVKDRKDFDRLSGMFIDDPENLIPLINIYKQLDHIPIKSGVFRFIKPDPDYSANDIEMEYVFSFFEKPIPVGNGEEKISTHFTIDLLTNGLRRIKKCEDDVCRVCLCLEFADNEIDNSYAAYTIMNPFNDKILEDAFARMAKEDKKSVEDVKSSYGDSHANAAIPVAYAILAAEYLSLINKENYIIESKSVLSADQSKSSKKKSKKGRNRIPLIRNVYTINLDKDKQLPAVKIPRKVGPRQFEFTTRGHWRHYKSGKVIWINEHLNCVGKPRKPKDYVANV